MADSDCSLMLEIFTKGTRFFKDCPLDLRVIQAYHPQVPKRCQQPLPARSFCRCLAEISRRIAVPTLYYPEGKMGHQKSLLERVPGQLSAAESGAVHRRKEVTLPFAVSLQSVSSPTFF